MNKDCKGSEIITYFHDPLHKGPENSTKSLVDLVTILRSIQGHKVSVQKSVLFSAKTMNTLKEIRKIKLFPKTEKMKYLGSILTKDMKVLYSEN